MSVINSDNQFVFSNGIVTPSINCNENLVVPTSQPSSKLGSIYFNTSNNLLNVFNGSSWVSMPGPTGSAGNNGNNGTNGVTGPAGNNGTGGPAFSAYASGQQTSIGNSVITFNSEEFDTSSTYDTSNSRWTPGVAGYYQINALVTSRFDTGGAGDIYIVLRKNGTQIKASTRFSSSASFINPTINTIVKLNATDYIDIYCYTSATFNTLPVFGAGTNQAWVYFNGCFLKSE